jgi:hypothetical protein
MRRRREYLELIDCAKSAAKSAAEVYNTLFHPYKDQTTLILMANAWELLAKGILVHNHVSILKDKKSGQTISGEAAVAKLTNAGLLATGQEQVIQQIISLRHAATHHILPEVPTEIMYHLVYYGCKFFREVLAKKFPKHIKDLPEHHLSISFSEVTTYADKIQKLVSRIKRGASEKQLVWLLERGVSFDGQSYITQREFEKRYRGKSRVLPHLALGEFVKSTDMVRIIPVEAPKNFTADITLRKGSQKDSTLPVVVRRTNLEDDFPFLTSEIARRIGKSSSFVAKALATLKIKDDPKYHEAIRASKSGYIHRYSEAALTRLSQHLSANPAFNPYKNGNA